MCNRITSSRVNRTSLHMKCSCRSRVSWITFTCTTSWITSHNEFLYSSICQTCSRQRSVQHCFTNLHLKKQRLSFSFTWLQTGHWGHVCRHDPAPWLRSRAAAPVFASPGLLGSQAVRVQIEPLSLAPQKQAQGPFPGSLAARGARIPRLGSFGLLAWLHIGWQTPARLSQAHMIQVHKQSELQ
jgi:hypothetical protein